MKRTMSFFLIISMLLCQFGCKQTEQEPNVPVTYYYPIPSEYYDTVAEVIGSEQRESQGHEQDLEYLLTQYLKGPLSPALTNSFPAGLRLIQIGQQDDQLYLTLSDHLAQLSGLDLTMACACLSMTCLELAEINTVHIRTESLPLDGESIITMSRDTLLLFDQTASSDDSTPDNETT